MNNNGEKIKELTLENYIWGIYIIIAFVNIYGDKLIKKSIVQKDAEANKKAMKIFRIIIIINIIIYIYFLKRNYKDLEKHNYDEAYAVRVLGSVLVLAGTLCFFYFQSKITVDADSLSNI